MVEGLLLSLTGYCTGTLTGCPMRTTLTPISRSPSTRLSTATLLQGTGQAHQEKEGWLRPKESVPYTYR